MAKKNQSIFFFFGVRDDGVKGTVIISQTAGMYEVHAYRRLQWYDDAVDYVGLFQDVTTACDKASYFTSNLQLVNRRF